MAFSVTVVDEIRASSEWGILTVPSKTARVRRCWNSGRNNRVGRLERGGLLGAAAAADLIINQNTARIADGELGAGLSIFHGNLDPALLSVSGGGSGKQGSDQQASDGFGCHGLGPSGSRFVLSSLCGQRLLRLVDALPAGV